MLNKKQGFIYYPIMMVLFLSGWSHGPRAEWAFFDMNFIVDGETRRDEVIFKLGSPSSTFEKGRILIYKAGKGDKGYFLVQQRADNSEPGWASDDDCENYHLVLVFDNNSVLEEHRLVWLGSR